MNQMIATMGYRVFFFIGCLCLITVLRAQEPAKNKPNVILIYSDDQGYADLGVYGAKDLKTPTLDSLAHHGVRFSQFYSASPICSPSRAALLTGRYPQRAGLPHMASSHEGDAGMPNEQYTLGEMFKDAGYKTAHIGKWHVGYTPETMPNAQGFDYSFGFMGGCIDNYSHFFYWAGPNRHDLWRNGQEVYQPGQYFPDLMVQEATSFMKQQQRNPFFLYFAINVPHYPLQGEKKWLDYYKNLPSPRDKYAAFVSTMDEKIGLLLQNLKTLGLAENTIVIFQPDQGFSKEERTFGGGGSAGIYRGSKFSLFEGGVRVPAIISWPMHIPKDEVRHQFAANVDWLPTLAELCHIDLPDRKIDGYSLTRIIQDAHAPEVRKEFFWQSGGSAKNPQWAVREGDWKLLHQPMEAKKDELDDRGLFLVNLKDDPAEKTNVAQAHPEEVSRLKKKYEQWVKEVVN